MYRPETEEPLDEVRRFLAYKLAERVFKPVVEVTNINVAKLWQMTQAQRESVKDQLFAIFVLLAARSASPGASR